MLPLLYVALFLQVGLPQPGIPIETHRQEIALLHRTINPEDLRNLEVWDQRFAEWRRPKAEEVVDDKAPILVVHLWAPWCKPCRGELPIWRDLGPRLEAQHKGKVRVVYVAIQTGAGDMDSFLPENKDRMPRAPWYYDLSERLAKTLRKEITDERLPLPMTLWLDRQRIVRQALVGSIGYRRAEVEDSTARLMRLVISQEGTARNATLHPKP